MRQTKFAFLLIVLLFGCSERRPSLQTIIPPTKDELAFAALYAGRVAELRLRLQEGASPEALDPQMGLTMLMKAAESNNTEAMEILLEAGANTETKSMLFQKTALFLSAYRGCDDATKLLIEKGANPNALDENGNNPLREAILGGRPSSIRLLLSAGANPNQVNNKGVSMIEIANGTEWRVILNSFGEKE